MQKEEKYTLSGLDGNAFAILAYVRDAMFHERFTTKEISEFTRLAMVSDYSNLICVSDKYVGMCNERHNARKTK